LRLKQARDPGAKRAGNPMIGEGSDQNAQDDGNGFAEFGGQNKGQQLRFVADFGEGDNASGYQECVQK
jgi:hypothetical protein